MTFFLLKEGSHTIGIFRTEESAWKFSERLGDKDRWTVTPVEVPTTERGK